jgi:hypothetical protein
MEKIRDNGLEWWRKKYHLAVERIKKRDESAFRLMHETLT